MKKVLFIALLLILMVGLVACGGVKYPSDKQVLEDIQGMNREIWVDGQAVSLDEQGDTDIYILDEAISFKSTEKPKTKDGQAYIRGILTLEKAGEIEFELRYDIFDDGTCEFSNINQR